MIADDDPVSREILGSLLRKWNYDLSKPFDKEELRARLNVGLRILTLQSTLAARVLELEATQSENRELKLRIPI